MHEWLVHVNAMDGGSIALNIAPTECIRSIKQSIKREQGYSIGLQQLITREGRELQDNLVLKESVTDGEHLYVIMRIALSPHELIDRLPFVTQLSEFGA
jgi:hypothetical protein